MNPTYKIHPAIGVARVGDSDDYYLGPVEAGGLPLEQDGSPFKGFRTDNGLRRQAAQFRVYIYDQNGAHPEGAPVVLGEGGIVDIQWTVHVANKKAAWRDFLQLDGSGPDGYSAGHTFRNPGSTGTARTQLIIDPGPQTLRCTQATRSAEFRRGMPMGGYKQTFPPENLNPDPIDTLGSMSTGTDGSLVVVGGYGRSGVCVPYSLSPDLLKNLAGDNKLTDDVVAALAMIKSNGYKDSADLDKDLQTYLSPTQYQTYRSTLIDAAKQPRLDTYANNNYWWDDISDGQVSAQLVLEGGQTVPVDEAAWVLVAPPAYAPEIFNMVTLYDTMYDLFVREFGYQPTLYSDGQFNPNYIPNLDAEILPILQRPAAYRWVADIGDAGTGPHGSLTVPFATFMTYIRDPNKADDFNTGLKMPWLAGDDPITPTSKYLALTKTQYFLLSQYRDFKSSNGQATDTAGPGEKLDRAVLENCVGGPFCPGIEMTWICRDKRIYSKPFRIRHKPVDPSVGLGLSEDLSLGMEPGDISRYMALPWQADFNECSIQNIDSAPYWWWPAQRPYKIFQDNTLSNQVFWTKPFDINFTLDMTMVYNWKNLGFIRSQGDGTFIEVERLPLELSKPGEDTDAPAA